MCFILMKFSIMKKTLYSKFDKAEIPSLPQVLFSGRIVEVTTEAEAKKAVNYLMSCDILGVDTETRPVFKKGQQHKVALLQVSSHDVCFLFRLNIMDITPSVKRLLEQQDVPMIGLSLHDDILVLHKRAEFTPGRFIDLQKLVGELGIQDLSLQKLYANIFHQRISKRWRLTNWEASSLNDKQRGYAATDAWACIMLYEEVNRLEATGDYELVKVEESDPLDDGGKDD